MGQGGLETAAISTSSRLVVSRLASGRPFGPSLPGLGREICVSSVVNMLPVTDAPMPVDQPSWEVDAALAGKLRTVETTELFCQGKNKARQGLMWVTGVQGSMEAWSGEQNSGYVGTVMPC